MKVRNIVLGVILSLILLSLPVAAQQLITVQLHVGENVLSAPVVLRDGNVLSVLKPLPISDAYGYKHGKWRSYHAAAPDFLHSLKMLELGRGYIVVVDEPCEITFRGLAPSFWAVSLTEGPNLVGWARMYPTTVRDAFDSVWDATGKVMRFDGTDWIDMLEDDIINPGEAYWIYVAWDCEWVVETKRTSSSIRP